MTKWEEFAAPLFDHETEWRVQQCGMGKNGKLWVQLVGYNDARAVMNRLDRVFGPENWRDEYRETSAGGETGYICRLYVRVGDGEWVWREDSSGASNIEPIKGGVSGAIRRAATKFGMGRELYEFGVVWGKNVHTCRERGEQYNAPPDAIVIADKKNNFYGWCDRPKIADLRKGKPDEKPQDVKKPGPAKPKPAGPKKGDDEGAMADRRLRGIKLICEIEPTAHANRFDRDGSRKKHLKDAKGEPATFDEKKKASNATMQSLRDYYQHCVEKAENNKRMGIGDGADND
jgi:hypothetical protein